MLTRSLTLANVIFDQRPNRRGTAANILRSESESVVSVRSPSQPTAEPTLRASFAVNSLQK